VAFCEANSGIVGHQGAMEEGGRLKPERAIEQNLPRGGKQQVCPAHHFGDPHRGIVHDHGELIGRNSVMPPGHKITEILSSDEMLRAEVSVHERNRFTVRDAKAPIQSGRSNRERGIAIRGFRFDHPVFRVRPARAGINGFLLALMRCLHGAKDILAGTAAGIDKASFAKPFERSEVERVALALRIRRKRSAAIRPFAPFQAEPFQIVVHGGDELRFATRKIQIFIAQDQRAGVLSGAFLSRPEGSGVTKMQQARR